MAADDPVYVAFVRNLKQAREAAGLSQTALADAVGQHQSFIAKVEAGQRRLDVAEAMRLAAVLGTTLQDLLPQIDQVELARSFPWRGGTN